MAKQGPCNAIFKNSPFCPPHYHPQYTLQHGFRERQSCKTQLIDLIDYLVNNLPNGQQTDLPVILFDFSKAFDKVNHLKLLNILQEHGLSL